MPGVSRLGQPKPRKWGNHMSDRWDALVRSPEWKRWRATLPQPSVSRVQDEVVEPEKISLAYRKASGRPLSVWVHPGIAARTKSVADFLAIHHPWKPARADGYVPRLIRGTVRISYHAAGLAVDWFDLPWPKPVDVWGPTNSPPASWLEIWSDAGWVIGADFTRRKDYPHVEWSRGIILKPGVLPSGGVKSLIGSVGD